MAPHPRSLKNGTIVYWLAFRWKGKTVWERSGYDKRAAEVRERQGNREIEDGTFVPKRTSGRLKVGTWLTDFLDARKNRAADYERDLITNHVLCERREWFHSIALQDIEQTHCLRLIEQIKAEGNLGSKSRANLWSLVRQAFKRATFEKLIASDPTSLPKGTIKWKSPGASKRRPYTREETRALISDDRVPPEARMFLAMGFYTGMREGEIAARRWSDLDQRTPILPALKVDSQYEDRPLKGDEDEGEVRPRLVPVHPELAALLRSWWAEGFEFVYCRKPTLDDRIVPHRKIGTHSKSSGYKLFLRALAATGIPSKTLHATRNTFLSNGQSNGAQKNVLEKVTHNSRGDVIDGYTEFEWRPLCEAVSRVDFSEAATPETFYSPLIPIANRAKNKLQSQDSNQEHDSGTGDNLGVSAGIDGNAGLAKTPQIAPAGVGFDASQTVLERLAAVGFRSQSAAWFRRAAA